MGKVSSIIQLFDRIPGFENLEPRVPNRGSESQVYIKKHKLYEKNIYLGKAFIGRMSSPLSIQASLDETLCKNRCLIDKF